MPASLKILFWLFDFRSNIATNFIMNFKSSFIFHSTEMSVHKSKKGGDVCKVNTVGNELRNFFVFS